jgi:hypothetical protein
LAAGETLEHESCSALRAKKKWRDRLIALPLGHPDWVLGFPDAVWGSRLAHPTLQTWTAAQPRRLLQNAPDRHDPEPQAVACSGLLRADTQGRLLRFVDGRPVSAVPTQFLGWLTEPLAAEGKTALLLVWDNASWHVSHAVQAWRKAHNRRVKQTGGGASWDVPCRVRVLGALAASRNGSRASGPLSHRIESWGLTN